MPVSDTAKATTRPDPDRRALRNGRSAGGCITDSVTPPLSVNLKAFDSRFLMICCNRMASVAIAAGSAGSISMSKDKPFWSAISRNCRSSCVARSSKRIASTSSTTVPLSILDRSRMSLIIRSSSAPDSWTVSACSTCFSLRLPRLFSASSLDRISRLFRGVRSSWLMLARNSDLYLEVSASCSAFSSSSSFLPHSSSCCWRSISSLSRMRVACSSSRSLVDFSSSCWSCNSPARSCDWLSSVSVFIEALIVFRTIPMLSTSWSRKSRWTEVKRLNEASSISAMTLPSKRTGTTTMLSGAASPRPERMRT